LEPEVSYKKTGNLKEELAYVETHIGEDIDKLNALPYTLP